MDDEVLSQIKEVRDKQEQLEHKFIETHVLLRQHTEDETRVWAKIDEIREELAKSNEHLAEYNRQLSVHIAGVIELRKANELTVQHLELYKREIELRLKPLEAPHIWADQTMSMAKWIGALAAASAAIYGLIRFFG